jgi:hypothetical protein
MGFNKDICMKNFLEKIGFKNALSLLGALLFLVMIVDSKCSSDKIKKLEAQLSRTEANLKAAQDSVRTTKAKDGSVEYDKLSYITKDIAELKKVNEQLAKEVEATKGKTGVIEKQTFTIIHDAVELKTQVDNRDGVVVIKGSYDTTYSKGNYRSLSTETVLKDSVATQKLTKDEIGFTATTGIKQTDKGYEIFVRPQYPGLKLTQLDGAIIESNLFKQPKAKQRLITVGATIGWTPITYDLSSKNFSLSTSRLGGTLGIQFNLFRN